MKAAVYFGRGDVRVTDVPAPGPIGEHEVLVQPLYAGICGTDVHEYVSGPDLIPTEPHPLTGASLPQILGHEFSARVVEVGADVTAIHPGDLAAIRPGVWCGTCDACIRGFQASCPSFTALGLNSKWGGLAELAVVREEQVAVMPGDVNPQQAALLEPTGVAVNAYTRAGVPEGARVLIAGAGPVGTLLAMYARAKGAGEVVVSEPHDVRRKMAADLGVGRTINPAALSPEELREIEDRFDFCFEVAGHPLALDLCSKAVRTGGTIVQTGLHAGAVQFDISRLNFKQASLLGTYCWPTEVMQWREIAELIASGRFPVEKLITSEIIIDDVVSDGIEALLVPGNAHQKILISIDG